MTISNNGFCFPYNSNRSFLCVHRAVVIAVGAMNMENWKIKLASFIKPDNTLNTPQNGQSILENLMSVILASEKWISRIKRQIFSMIIWLAVSIVVFFVVLYQANSVQVQLVENGLLVFAVALALVVYFSVDLQFGAGRKKLLSSKVTLQRSGPPVSGCSWQPLLKKKLSPTSSRCALPWKSSSRQVAGGENRVADGGWIEL